MFLRFSRVPGALSKLCSLLHSGPVRLLIPSAMPPSDRGGAAPMSCRLERTARPRSRDADVHKGAMEDGRPSATTNAPGLDNDGLPNDETAIAEDAIGARADGSQG